MQALILVGGEGTRLRPLTSRVPKPVIALAGRPFMSYMLEWLRGHGVDRVILSCGFLPDGVRAVLGDGSEWGVALTYVEEPARSAPAARSSTPRSCSTSASSCSTATCSPTSTSPRNWPSTRRPVRGGRSRSIRSTIPRRTGSSAGARTTRSASSSRSRALEEIDTHLINAGAYILEQDVLDEMAPAGLAHLDRARPVPATRRPRALRLRGVGLLDGHRDPAALPAGHLGHPRDRGAHRGRHAIRQAGGVLCPEELPAGTIHAPAVIGPAARSPPTRASPAAPCSAPA